MTTFAEWLEAQKALALGGINRDIADDLKRYWAGYLDALKHVESELARRAVTKPSVSQAEIDALVKPLKED